VLPRRDFGTIVVMTEIPPETPLRDCPKLSTNIYWPIPIDERLNELVDLAKAEGEALSRADLLGALVLEARPDGGSLGVLVRAYRRTPANQTFVHARDAILTPHRKRGRRPG
jgi:hypothetical protein